MGGELRCVLLFELVYPGTCFSHHIFLLLFLLSFTLVLELCSNQHTKHTNPFPSLSAFGSRHSGKDGGAWMFLGLDRLSPLLSISLPLHLENVG